MNNTGSIKSKFTINTLQLTKWGACIYILASKALVPLGIMNGIVQFGILIITTLLTLFMDRGKPKIYRFLVIEFAFVSVTFVTSILVAKSQTWVFNSVQVMIYALMFGYTIISVSIKEHSIVWFLKAWIFSGIILVSYIFITGGYSSGRLARLSTTEGMNTNTLGIYLMIAVWATLYLISFSIGKQSKVVFPVVIGILIIALFLYVLFGTGSRKALITCLFVIVYWIVFVMIPTFKQVSFQRRALALIIGCAVVFFLYYRFGTSFSNISVTMTTRMYLLSNEDVTNLHRFNLIKDSIIVFLDHPILGVGWNNYRLYSFSHQYSHCTYTEVLACTGIIGFSLAVLLWKNLIAGLIQLVRSRVDRNIIANVLALFLAFLFIDAVQIMYYNSSLLMIMHLLVAIPLAYNKKGKFYK